jgi:hypothetical protein
LTTTHISVSSVNSTHTQTSKPSDHYSSLCAASTSNVLNQTDQGIFEEQNKKMSQRETHPQKNQETNPATNFLMRGNEIYTTVSKFIFEISMIG